MVVGVRLNLSRRSSKLVIVLDMALACAIVALFGISSLRCQQGLLRIRHIGVFIPERNRKIN
ncbi:hypothetical protein MC7420_6615 [Coleofasciculus chthonoplastes PCC 7420]|uniref:Uncharacterized protein n=1 Tax=Coleofasciculus chthonoplastes PCC 7420 TaxID=118168 RepID=B4W423_9CYAN|nr:hypothetical protein MC7420_6615 [Coleofasciculus chthonoplastes PCC 7420]